MSTPTIRTLTFDEALDLFRKGQRFERHSMSLSWYGGNSYAECLDFIEHGWPDAPALPHIDVPAIAGNLDDVTYNYDVTGEILDIASYVDGIPECWLQPEIVTVKRSNVIRISAEIGGLRDVKANHIKHRGLGIIMLIESLELAGYSIELTIVRSFSTESSVGPHHVFLIPVKQAGEALNQNRLNFTFGHTGFFRRLLFGMYDAMIGRKISDLWTQKHAPEGYDWHIPHDRGWCDTLQESQEFAQREMKLIAAKMQAS